MIMHLLARLFVWRQLLLLYVLFGNSKTVIKCAPKPIAWAAICTVTAVVPPPAKFFFPAARTHARTHVKTGLSELVRYSQLQSSRPSCGRRGARAAGGGQKRLAK